MCDRQSNRVSGFIYGLQASSWQTGDIIEPGLTKIGSTTRSVDQRVSEMQRSLGAGGAFRLVVAFSVKVDDLRVERAVHAILRDEGRHLQAGSACEWFCIDPAEARAIVEGFASGARDIDATFATRPATSRRNRSSIRGPKEIKMTPKRAKALAAIRSAASAGGSLSDFAGGRRGAAATALAVEEGISKHAANILIKEWFARTDV